MKHRMRVCLWYDFKQGKTAKESHKTLSNIFKNDAYSERECRLWFKRLNEGDESLEDHGRGHPPSALDDSELLKAVEEDPRLSTRELAKMFDTGHTTIEEHLHRLGKANRVGKWVPHQLTDAHKATRSMMSSILLRQSKAGGFWESILTSDEKWIFYENPTRKREWLSPGQQPLTTPKVGPFGKKAMLCVWWNCRGLIYFEVLEYGRTVNADLYLQQLDRVDDALRAQGVEPTNVRYLQDNARAHTAYVTLDKLEELGWECLPHPPYSPDLALSDYHLFRSMQHHLADKSFKDLNEIEIWVRQYFASQPSDFFDKGIRDLRKKWKKVVEIDGEYLLD